MMNNQKNNYQKNRDTNIWLSGQEATLFAEYKALKIKELCRDVVNKPIAILDFGCADGVMTSFIKEIFTNARVAGVDISQDHIKVAQMAYKDIEFALSGRTVPHTDNSFDLVIAAETFHHIPFDEHDHYLKEVFRLLKPGGTFILFELNPFNPKTRYHFNRNPTERHAKMLSSCYSKRLIKKDFNSVSIRFYNFFSKKLTVFEFLESYMAFIPLGSFYACVSSKTMNG